MALVTEDVTVEVMVVVGVVTAQLHAEDTSSSKNTVSTLNVR
jgi:hypothetical protein